MCHDALSPMNVVCMLPHKEFGQNDHRKDAPLFTQKEKDQLHKLFYSDISALNALMILDVRKVLKNSSMGTCKVQVVPCSQYTGFQGRPGRVNQ